MLTRIDLMHFKCFPLLKLPLNRLTLLSGPNASGKSSVLQALVLIHQTIREHEWSTRLQLNGSELQLGTVADIVDKVTGRRAVSIGLNDDYQCAVHWTFEGEDRKDMSMRASSVDAGGKTHAAPEKLRFLLPDPLAPDEQELANRLRRLSYLTAERVGPRDVYPLADPALTLVVGPRGEFAASLLHWGRDESVVDALVLEDAPPTRLRQVASRMHEFFPGCSIDVQQVPAANSVTLGLRTSEATDFHRPIHVGFGVTQVLPIVVAALAAKSNDLLLIENPEVHLHPAGQAMMGIFLSAVAGAGVQVLIETHSDHLLNGIRRSVRNGLVKSEQVAIHFFRDRDADGDQVVTPTIDRTGNIDSWPEGFFDQFDKDMNHFAGWGD